MWPKAYKNYPTDTPLIKEQVESGQGIVGCEMHDLNGWGDDIHRPPQKKRKGIIASLLAKISNQSHRTGG